MVQCDATGLGQLQLSTPAFKQGVTQTFFQLFDLHRKSRLRQVQTLRRSGQVTVMRNGPKISEMVIVQWHIVLFIRTQSHKQ
jgi:hypothetical protein